ncbi:MAG: hypothetical protein Q8J74_08190 [Candidatus Didemnitutus sp.]|nr:hypothetical protein [Candidatus Didemnitutus sp.]
MKTPEIIITEFEQRRASERKEKRSKMAKRGLELVGWIGASLAYNIWVSRQDAIVVVSQSILLGGVVVAYIIWKTGKLEDRIAELEQRAEGKPNQLKGFGGSAEQ